MKKINFLAVGVVVMVVLAVVFMTKPISAPAAEGEKCFVVSLHSIGKTGTGPVGATAQVNVNVVPQYTRVPKGSCVVWVNWIPQFEIQLSFKEGKVCQDATETPIRFSVQPGTGCYITDFKQLGETSSLRFMQVGTYKYEIKMAGKIAPIATGEVTVH